ncbi:UNVERIFIED_CONTAM: hypothetical protein K2H54_065611, partial [Gekko kuhli]
ATRIPLGCAETKLEEGQLLRCLICKDCVQVCKDRFQICKQGYGDTCPWIPKTI